MTFLVLFFLFTLSPIILGLIRFGNNRKKRGVLYQFLRIIVILLIFYGFWKVSLFLIPLLIGGALVAGIALARSPLLWSGIMALLKQRRSSTYNRSDFERHFHHSNQHFFHTSSPPPPSSSSGMTVGEAYKILEVSPQATQEEIKKAYHRLMKKMHPDQGGSTYLAEKINQARDILLKK